MTSCKWILGLVLLLAACGQAPTQSNGVLNDAAVNASPSLNADGVDANYQGLKFAEIDSADIPQIFTDHDKVEMTIAGNLRDSCYELTNQQVQKQGQKIFVYQGTNKTPGVCLFALFPFTQKFAVGTLPSGSYQVFDGATNKFLGDLPIKQSN